MARPRPFPLLPSAAVALAFTVARTFDAIAAVAACFAVAGHAGAIALLAGMVVATLSR